MIFQAQMTMAPPTRDNFSPSPLLQRKCACGGAAGPTGECEECKRKRVQTKLTVNAPGDRFEREADAMAQFVTGASGRGIPPLLSPVRSGAIQREDKPAPPKPNNYEDAAKKIAEALAETPVGKELKAKAAEMGKDFLSSVEGKVIAGSALGGALAAIIATNSDLPAQLPEVPLDFIAPGLKAKLVYEGPVQKPTSVSLKLTSKSGVSVTGSYSSTPASGDKPAEQKGGLTLTIPLGGSSEKKKGGPTESEKFRAETARLAAEQAKFREGLKTPRQKAEEQEFVDSYVRSKNIDPTNPLGLPPLKKKEDPLLMRKEAGNSAVPLAAPQTVPEAVEDSGQPLDAATRGFMERRFGHDFGEVRVHLGERADASARTFDALAYTVGHDIVFRAGAFAPGDSAGRRLLAHELAHVVQQSHTSAASLQRQPDETTTKAPPPPAKAAPRKTLKDEGVDLNDPVASGTAAIIDTVLARNQKLSSYIGDKIQGGLRIAEKGKLVHELSDGNFEDSYRKAYNLNSGETVPKSTMGFFDPKKSEIHLRPDALFGTALHEAVHRLASPALYSTYLSKAKEVSSTLLDVLVEGVTAFFTDEILKEEKLPSFNDAYRSKKEKAQNLVDALKPDGFDLMANFNFKGTHVIEIGEKLGYTRKQFGDSKGAGIKEVMKRMAKAL